MEPLIIENLQVWPDDLGKMTWEEATERVKELGPGWRLPTIEEFDETLYPNRKEMFRVLKHNWYWSSSVYTGNNRYMQYYSLIGGESGYGNTFRSLQVIAVRDLTGEAAIELLLKDF
jgi:hypothetical protein